jgi:hypothetical protein
MTEACFAEGLAYSPELVGTVTLRLELDGEGQVTASALERTTMKSEPVEMCPLSRACEWRFPAPGAPAVAIVAPTFSP